jgi:hypothetical protein
MPGSSKKVDKNIRNDTKNNNKSDIKTDKDKTSLFSFSSKNIKNKDKLTIDSESRKDLDAIFWIEY